MIVCDTGPIVAASFTNQPRHHECTDLFTGPRLSGRRLLLPATVAAEVGYFLERYGSPDVEARWLAAVAQGDFEPIDLTSTDYARMAELVGTYDDFPLGTTDASVVAVAERLGATDVATLDRRHFSAIRPCHVDHLTLLPERLG